jgi:hypothetical protein
MAAPGYRIYRTAGSASLQCNNISQLFPSFASLVGSSKKHGNNHYSIYADSDSGGFHSAEHFLISRSQNSIIRVPM